MLTAASDAQALLARLNAVPAAVQQAVDRLARAAAPGQAKAAEIARLARRSRDRRLHPDRTAAMARLCRPPRAPQAMDADRLSQAAVQAALKALGRG